MPGTWDGPSTAVSLLLAAGGIASAAVAASVCHSETTTAHFFLILAALFTLQLLAFAVTCFAYRHWVVTSAAAQRHGPGVDEPCVRRGLPALKSTGKCAGLDGWSFLLIAVLVIPVIVSALAFRKPSEKARFKTTRQDQMGLARASASVARRNGANKYTVSAYETVQLAVQAQVPDTPNQDIKLSNTASVAINVSNDRVYTVSHVPAACMYPEVLAHNITALVGSYSCNFDRSRQEACPPSDYANGKNVSCISISNSTAAPGVTRQVMAYRDAELAVVCSVTFSLAQVDVTWRGDDQLYTQQGRGRDCYIADLKLRQDTPMMTKDWAKWENYWDMLGNVTLQPLKLSLISSFVYMVSKERVRQSSDESLRDYFGAVFSTAALVRTTGQNFDPTQSRNLVEVRYASKICKQYGWSGFIIFLIVANALLVACCIAISSGVAMKQVAGDLSDGFGSLRSKVKCPGPGNGKAAPDGHMPVTAANYAPSIQHSQSSQQPSQGSGPAVTANTFSS